MARYTQNGSRAPRPGRAGEAGFTYLTILFVVAIMGVGLALTGEVWHTAAVRDREAELLHTGTQYRRAIERYYLAGTAQYPRALADLLQDPRKPVMERYLRRLNPDPVTGNAEWGIVKAPDGGVMGVYSLSENAPVKAAGFAAWQSNFAAAKSYRDWQFVYTPGVAAAGKAPGNAPVQVVPGGVTQPAPSGSVTISPGLPQPSAPPPVSPSGTPDPVAPARERQRAQVPREPWVCNAARANDLRACERVDGPAAGALEACRSQAAERYRICISGSAAAAASATTEAAPATND